MRPSKRVDILEAAARIVQRHGVASVTYDSIAVESGITKGGLLYHFPSREELITSLHDHLATRWEDGMATVAGKPAAEATDIERLVAYIGAAAQSATRAELLFLLEGSTTPDHAAPWKTVLMSWAPHAPHNSGTRRAMELFVARLAADGLWMHESLSPDSLDPNFRNEIASLIVERISSYDNRTEDQAIDD